MPGSKQLKQDYSIMSQFNDNEAQDILNQIQSARLNERRIRRNEHLVTLGFLAVIILLQVSTILQIRAIPVRCELPLVLGLK